MDWDNFAAKLGGLGDLGLLLLPDLRRRTIAMPAATPLLVVGSLEGQERQPKFLDGTEAANPDGNAVAVRRLDRQGFRQKITNASYPVD